MHDQPGDARFVFNVQLSDFLALAILASIVAAIVLTIRRWGAR